MAQYIHHVPGRLRIKAPVLKRNEQEAKAVQELLLDQQGILRSEVNTLTGSILIHYDGSVVQVQWIVGLLERQGYLAPSVAVHPPLYPSNNRCRVREKSCLRRWWKLWSNVLRPR